MKRKNSNVKRDLREKMFRQKFYNEKPIKGYNHLLGTLDARGPVNYRVERVCSLRINSGVLTSVINVVE